VSSEETPRAATAYPAAEKFPVVAPTEKPPAGPAFSATQRERSSREKEAAPRPATKERAAVQVAPLGASPQAPPGPLAPDPETRAVEHFRRENKTKLPAPRTFTDFARLKATTRSGAPAGH
jgi:hypothetical protein